MSATNVERPDLSHVDPTVRAYIDALEAELERLRRAAGEESPGAGDEPTPAFSEPPTTVNVITISQAGMAKRTPRHHYTRQHRGGMGIFDLETPEGDPPACLTIADESDTLLLLTQLGCAFRLPARALPETEVHSRGESLSRKLPLEPGERLVTALPAQDSGYLVLVGARGQVRRLRYQYVGENLEPGSTLFDVKTNSSLAVACWTPGDADLFIATRQGNAIRFNEQEVPVRGCLGIRVAENDEVVAVTAVQPDGGVFLLGADGKGTVRLMSGFSANKSPGGSGKMAMKTDQLVGAVQVNETEDLFVISRLGKIIRFLAAEVPAKEGVVQGVNCMALRADETVAMAKSRSKV